MRRFNSSILQAIIFIILSSSAYSQTETMDFVLLDSIQSNHTSYILAKDITDDGLDELFVCNYDGLFIYNGSDRSLYWADSIQTDSVRWVEVGDIEQDGDFELFLSTYGNGNYHLWIYPGMDIGARYQWPGYLEYTPTYLYFYFENDTPYLNFMSSIGIRINLMDWSYISESINVGDVRYYNDYFYTIHVQYIPYDNIRYTLIKYDLNYELLESERIHSYGYPDYNSFAYTFGDFAVNENTEIFYHSNTYSSDDTAYLKLYMLNDDFEQIFYYESNEIAYPENFISINLTGDNKDELFMSAYFCEDTLEACYILLDGNANIVGYAQGDAISIESTCNIDNDEYDEFIQKDDHRIYLYNVELEIVGINDNEEFSDIDNLQVLNNLRSYPNPFNNRIIINFNVTVSGYLSVDIYNLLGQKVETLCHKYEQVGEKVFVWDPQINSYNSGVYFAVIEINGQSTVKRMVYLK